MLHTLTQTRVFHVVHTPVHSSYFAFTQRENLIQRNHMPAREPPWLVHCQPLKPQLHKRTGHIRAFGAFGAANPVAKN